MKLSRSYFPNRRLLKGLKDDSTRFKPTISDIERWFDILNQQIFGGKLPQFDSIRIARPKGVHALFQCWEDKDGKTKTKLIMTQVFRNEKTFVEILAHEMIHLFQHKFKEPLGHGPSFWIWRDIFSLKGINLHKAV